MPLPRILLYNFFKVEVVTPVVVVVVPPALFVTEEHVHLGNFLEDDLWQIAECCSSNDDNG